MDKEFFYNLFSECNELDREIIQSMWPEWRKLFLFLLWSTASLKRSSTSWSCESPLYMYITCFLACSVRSTVPDGQTSLLSIIWDSTSCLSEETRSGKHLCTQPQRQEQLHLCNLCFFFLFICHLSVCFYIVRSTQRDAIVIITLLVPLPGGIFSFITIDLEACYLHTHPVGL